MRRSRRDECDLPTTYKHYNSSLKRSKSMAPRAVSSLRPIPLHDANVNGRLPHDESSGHHSDHANKNSAFQRPSGSNRNDHSALHKSHTSYKCNNSSHKRSKSMAPRAMSSLRPISSRDAEGRERPLHNKSSSHHSDSASKHSAYYRERFSASNPHDHSILRMSHFHRDLTNIKIRSILDRELKDMTPFEIEIVDDGEDEDRVVFLNFKRTHCADKVLRTMVPQFRRLLGKYVTIDSQSSEKHFRDRSRERSPIASSSTSWDRFSSQFLSPPVNKRVVSSQNSGIISPMDRQFFHLNQGGRQMPDAVFVGTLPLEVCHMLMNNPEYSTHLASTERLNSTDRGKNVARANSLLGSQLMALQDMTKTREREMFARHDPAMISRNQRSPERHNLPRRRSSGHGWASYVHIPTRRSSSNLKTVSHSNCLELTKCRDEKFPNLNQDDGLASRTLFVGNLPNDICEAELGQVFDKYAQVENIDIKMFIGNEDKNRSYAFILFYTVEDAMEALHMQHNKAVRPGSENCQIEYSTTDSSSRLYVGSLSPGLTAKKLKKQFAQFGHIERIDYEDGDSCAYIRFDDPKSASNACSRMRNFELNKGKRITVDFAKDDGKDEKTQKKGPSESENDKENKKRSGGSSESCQSNFIDVAKNKKSRRKRHSKQDNAGINSKRSKSHYLSSQESTTTTRDISTVDELKEQIACTWKGLVILKKIEFPLSLHRIFGKEQLLQDILRDEAGNALKLVVKNRFLLNNHFYRKIITFDENELALMIGVEGNMGKYHLQISAEPLVKYLKKKDATGVITVDEGVIYVLTDNEITDRILQHFAPHVTLIKPGTNNLLIALIKIAQGLDVENKNKAGSPSDYNSPNPVHSPSSSSTIFAPQPVAPSSSKLNEKNVPEPPQKDSETLNQNEISQIIKMADELLINNSRSFNSAPENDAISRVESTDEEFKKPGNNSQNQQNDS
ncbi:RNA recognition motif domain-containing protein [Ditylenchus destructor]|uniref:RNA recognition motif domain-containing protein n=1 Tax=Ditylenchus destructor TaxID=166010 RepID=A0AAD4N9X0_9BILA|nr:RNA recognition motif domain-containing protein [Ditylenchus destructor]